MPFIKLDKPHKCKLPGTTWRGGKPRELGTQWYCSECRKLYEIAETEDHHMAVYWREIGIFKG